MYNKTIIKFVFSDIQNKQGKGYQPQPLALADISTSALIVLDITKTSSNNCLLTECSRPIGVLMVSLLYNNKNYHVT